MTDWNKIPTRQELCNSLMQLDLHNGWNFEVEYGIFTDEDGETDVFYTKFFKNGLEIFTTSDDDGVSEYFQNTQTITADEALLIVKYLDAVKDWKSLDDSEIMEAREDD